MKFICLIQEILMIWGIYLFKGFILMSPSKLNLCYDLDSQINKNYKTKSFYYEFLLKPAYMIMMWGVFDI